MAEWRESGTAEGVSMTHQSAFIRRGDRVVIADVIEKAKVDALVASIRQALDIEDKQAMHAAITRVMDEFEGEK